MHHLNEEQFKDGAKLGQEKVRLDGIGMRQENFKCTHSQNAEEGVFTCSQPFWGGRTRSRRESGRAEWAAAVGRHVSLCLVNVEPRTPCNSAIVKPCSRRLTFQKASMFSFMKWLKYHPLPLPRPVNVTLVCVGCCYRHFVSSGEQGRPHIFMELRT